MAVGTLVTMLTGTPAGSVQSEIVLVSGRVRVARGVAQEKARIDSRKFEVAFLRRNGKTISAQACLFADLIEDQDWDGGCFRLTLLPQDESIATQAVSTKELAPVDPPAQRLLRMLAADTEAQRYPERRIIGFDPQAPFTIHTESFPEADL